MTRPEQIDLVTAICDNIKNDMIKKIKEDKVPEEWDGFEFHYWLAVICLNEDYYSSNIWLRENQSHKARKRDCENIIIQNNLT